MFITIWNMTEKTAFGLLTVTRTFVETRRKCPVIRWFLSVLIFKEGEKMYNVIVRLFGLWYIAAFENGVMQYSIYGGYKREQDAKRAATIHNIKITEIRR